MELGMEWQIFFIDWEETKIIWKHDEPFSSIAVHFHVFKSAVIAEFFIKVYTTPLVIFSAI